MNEKYSILITGSTGFCGSYLSKYFKDKSDKYLVYTTSRSLQDNDMYHIKHDLLNVIPHDLFPKKIDCIIHCAANVNQHDSEFSIIADNLRTAFNICTYALETKCHFFINFSSITVYGKNESNNPVTEDSDTFTYGVYGLSKLLVENLINAMLSKFVQIVNLRLGYIIDRNIPSRYFLSRFRESLLKGEIISLVNPDSTRFSFIELADIANICDLLFTRKIKGTFNIVGDEAPTLRQIIQEMQKYFTIPFYLNETIKKSEEFAVIFSNEKIKKFLGIHFKPYRESFKDMFLRDDSNG